MILLLNGFKGNGKDYVANKLLKYNEFKDFKIKKFASPLRDFIKKYFNINDERLETEKETLKDEIFGLTIREMMIIMGQGIKDYKNKNYFVKKLSEEISEKDNVIITDWRFIEEYEYLLNNSNQKIITIRIEKKCNKIGKKYNMENELDDFKFDYIFYNTLDKEKFNLEIQRLIKFIKY